MKKNIKLLSILLLTITILLTGCALGREELKLKGEGGTITFKVKKGHKYKLSTNKKDLRSPREEGIIIGKDFKIGIEFNDDFAYFYDSDFYTVKKKRRSEKDYQEVTYSNMEGVQYFYPSYNRYNVLLPCGKSKKYMISLYIYGKDNTKKSAQEAIKNKEVLDILNHIVEVKEKEK